MLAQQLITKKLSLIGTLRKNKTEVSPAVLPLQAPMVSTRHCLGHISMHYCAVQDLQYKMICIF